jgi:hypothetical protein
MSELTGRELDAAVAREVMGLDLRTLKSYCHLHGHKIGLGGFGEDPEGNSPYCYTCYRYWGKKGPSGWDGIYHACPPYSTDLNKAMQVVEQMGEHDLYFSLEEIDRWKGPRWAVYFKGGDFFEATGATIPEAICRAALAAVCATTAPASPADA